MISPPINGVGWLITVCKLHYHNYYYYGLPFFSAFSVSFCAAFSFSLFFYNSLLLSAQAAQIDCSISDASFQEGLGGTAYDDRDPGTYWTQPQQFCTW